MNPFRRILLGTGCLPDELRGEVMAEGVLLLEEGLRGSVTYRHYRAPGRRANWSKSGLYTALAVTSARVVVASERGKTVDCPRDQDGMEVSTDGPDRLLLVFDAAKLSHQRSGRVEVRLRLPDAQRAVVAIGKPSTILNGV
jgi:hypothetical protein